MLSFDDCTAVRPAAKRKITHAANDMVPLLCLRRRVQRFVQPTEWLRMYKKHDENWWHECTNACTARVIIIAMSAKMYWVLSRAYAELKGEKSEENSHGCRDRRLDIKKKRECTSKVIHRKLQSGSSIYRQSVYRLNVNVKTHHAWPMYGPYVSCLMEAQLN
jgi:hypothetical protein